MRNERSISAAADAEVAAIPAVPGTTNIAATVRRRLTVIVGALRNVDSVHLSKASLLYARFRCSDVTKFSIYGHQVHAAIL